MVKLEDFSLKLADFFKKYNIPHSELGTSFKEFSRYIYLYINSENPKIALAKIFAVAIEKAFTYGMKSEVIPAAESKLGGNFLKEFDDLISLLAGKDHKKLSAAAKLQEIAINILCVVILLTTPNPILLIGTILEIKARIDGGNSYLDPENIKNFNVYKDKYEASDKLLLGKDSRFYNFMMNQDSDKLAKTFIEAEPGNPGLLDKLKAEEVIKDAPSDLIEKIFEVTKKVLERQGSPYIDMIKDVWNDIVEVIQKFLNFIKDKEIPGFDKPLKELTRCIDYQTNKSSEANTKSDKEPNKEIKHADRYLAKDTPSNIERGT